MLTIPAPTLAFEPQAPGVAALELPLTVSLGAVTGEDGAALGPADLSTFGLVSYRTLTAGSLPEVWATGARQWVPEGDPAATGTEPLAFLVDEPQPWQALVVPV